MQAYDLGLAVAKLALACVLGGLVGWQREVHERPAGFRTHVLVCVGSCLVMIVSLGTASLDGTGTYRFDPGRIAAQVVSGIGFLGAGTILRQGNVVRGLTTAASLWTVAAIGLATGLGGFYACLAALATLLVLTTLTLFNRLEMRLIERRQLRDVTLTVPREQVLGIVRFFSERSIGIKSIETERSDIRGSVRVRLALRISRRIDMDTLTHSLLSEMGVQSIDWE